LEGVQLLCGRKVQGKASRVRRRAARVDGNHVEIVQIFRDLGCSVLSLAAMGKGVPDLLIGLQGVTWLVEVKTPKGKLTPDQGAFKGVWQGSWAVVRDREGVERVIRMMLAQAHQMSHTQEQA
jgi:hypothetical protein